MKIFKNSIIKVLGITLLIIGGSVSAMALPKFLFVILTKIVDAIPTDPTYDKDGKMIYRDGRHTIASFGKRKEFHIWRNGSKNEVSWILFDRDKNNGIDKIRYFTRSSSSPCVYSLGKKGYTKLNYETGEIIQSKNINDFQGDDKTVFEKLEVTKSKAENDQEKFEVSWEWIFS